MDDSVRGGGGGDERLTELVTLCIWQPNVGVQGFHNNLKNTLRGNIDDS